MSINSCTIDCNTIDAICNDRRSQIINTLLGSVIVVSALAFPNTVDVGNVVTGTVTFTNSGPGIANENTYALTLAPGLSGVVLTSLPGGVTYGYNSLTGVVTLTGMPIILTSGVALGPITINYIQPSGGSTVSALITTTSIDPDPGAGFATTTISAGNVPPPPFFGGHHPQKVNPDNRLNLNMFHRRDVDREEIVETETLELPQIAVTVTMHGESSTHTLDRGDENFVPMINVYSLAVKNAIEEPVITVDNIRLCASANDTVEESVNITIDNIRIL